MPDPTDPQGFHLPTELAQRSTDLIAEARAFLDHTYDASTPPAAEAARLLSELADALEHDTGARQAPPTEHVAPHLMTQTEEELQRTIERVDQVGQANADAAAAELHRRLMAGSDMGEQAEAYRLAHPEADGHHGTLAVGDPVIHRYAVFAFNDYYASGGIFDLHGSFPTEVEALDHARTFTHPDALPWQRVEGVDGPADTFRNAHVVDLHRGTVTIVRGWSYGNTIDPTLTVDHHGPDPIDQEPTPA